MALASRSQPAAVNILQVWYEECTISYYAEGSRDVIGAPALTLTQRNTNVPCDIQPLVAAPTFSNQAGTSDIQEQGVVKQSSHVLFVAAGQTIEPRDVITDVDSDTYDVLVVNCWRTHTECMLAKRN